MPAEREWTDPETGRHYRSMPYLKDKRGLRLERRIGHNGQRIWVSVYATSVETSALRWFLSQLDEQERGKGDG